MKAAIPQSVHIRKKRSVKLSIMEVEQLKTLRDTYDTQDDFAAAVGVDRVTLGRIIDIGRGSEDNISKVRKKLSQAEISKSE